MEQLQFLRSICLRNYWTITSGKPPAELKNERLDNCGRVKGVTGSSVGAKLRSGLKLWALENSP